MAEPLCPQCGESDWAISKQTLVDLGGIEDIRETGIKLEADVLLKMAANAPQHNVVFVYCHSCGHVITASFVNGNS